MKVLVIGGTQGVGKNIVDYFAPDSFSVSRANGYNINDKEKRLEIAILSTGYDIVVNHAYSGNLSQSYMLQELYDVWSENDKDGYIFNTGSYATWSDNFSPNIYPGIKKVTDTLCRQMSKRVENNLVKFRLTNIRPGMLDTEKSRQKPHWAGNGVRGEDISKIIEFLYNLPSDVTIPDFVISERSDV